MVDNKSPAPLATETGKIYEIKVKGHLDEHWDDWLGGLTISHNECGYSILSGCIIGQSALYGILTQIRDLGLTLISLIQQTPEKEH